MPPKTIPKRNNIICIDFETGGLDPTKNPITQVALQSFRIDNFEEIGRYSSYVKPYDNLKYEAKAMEYTGITVYDLENGIDVEQMVKDLCEEFKKSNISGSHTKKSVLLGHNIAFDIGFLQYAFNKRKVDLSKFIECKIDGYGNPIPIFYDTMLLARQKWSGDESMTRFNLASCCEKANIDLFDAHDAFNDVSATKDLFIYLTNNMRSGESSMDSSQVKFRHSFEF